MDNCQARQYFKDKGLTYDFLNIESVKLLELFLQEEIEKAMSESDDCILIKINRYRFTKKQRQSNKFSNLALTVKGTYFKDREAITFSDSGFIGFAGWASTRNTQPFIDGFIRWCDVVVNNRAVQS
jgi:hypothetical protein